MLRIPRRAWILSGIVFLLMLAVWLFLPPVIIDTFDPKRPPTMVEILIVNLLFYWWLLFPPPLVALLVGWIVQRIRNRNQDSN